LSYQSAPPRIVQGLAVTVVLATAALPFVGEFLFPTEGFQSQGTTFNWDPVLLLFHLISDLSIGIAYVGISITLIVFARRAGRRVPFLWAFVAFGVFIISCGLTHFMAALTLWEPLYWTAGGVKYITAISSVGTAIAVPPLVPKALALVEEARLSAQRQRELERSYADLQKQATALAQLASIVESAQDAIVSRTLDEIVTSWNPGAERLYGYRAEEMLGQPFARLVPPDRQDELATIRERIARGDVIPPFETVRLRKDGSRVPVSVALTPLRDAGGAVVGMAAITRDIFDQQRAAQQLRRAERLETAGRIAGQVAHDFNNLLSPLAGYPELIERQLPEAHPARAYCGEMLRAVRRMVEINTDLLTLGRRGHFAQEAVDLNQLVEEALQAGPDRPSSLYVNLALDEELLAVVGSGAQLLRVVTNLIQNARDAMEDQGQLGVSTTNIYLDQPLRRYADVAVGEYVRLAVTDTGVGIAPEIEDRIFDAFFTTKASDRQRGSGLGLSVVQAVVTDHGGYVDFIANQGVGTTFEIYLPASRQAVALPPPQVLIPGDESILIVDDDSLQRRVLTEFLQTLGYRVGTCESGEQALAHTKNQPYDLVILDMVMPPGIDGAETYRLLRARYPAQRAILLSGFAESERVAAAQALGAGAFVRKPVSLEQLSSAVRAELDRPP